ncbi:MAG: TRAP transporter small permease, partial [Burkholderiales bacterium]
DVVLGLLMLAGVALNFVAVFSRYVLGSAIFWTEEVLVLITIWGVFIGCVAIAWKGEHLSMDLFSSKLRGLPKRVLRGATAATLVATSAFVAWQSWQIVALFVATDAVSAGARIPKVIPHSALLAGFGLMALVVIVRIRAYLSGDFGGRL